jgi:probable rRNA maturation factor
LLSLIFENQTSKDISLNILEKITNELNSKQIEFILCHNDYIKSINNQFRQNDVPTDVLSFPYENMPNTPLGSIVISIDFVEQKAKELKHSIQDELTLLFIHGLLHLLGYDHEIDNGEHREKEEELIKKYKLPNSLIVRNSLWI